MSAVAMTGAALLVIASSRDSAHAAAFANGIQSASTGAVATAGSTAIAGDASTIYYNPAGMSLLNRPEVLSNGAALDISTRFQNGGTLDPLGNPVHGSSGNKDQYIAIPALFATLPISDRIYAGIGVFSPFGQINTIPSDWVGRYQIQRTALKTVDVDMAVSFKVTDSVSVGAGVDAQRAHYFRGSALDFGSLCAISIGPVGCGQLGLSPQAADGSLNVDFVNWSAGFNLGLLYNGDDVTHFGLSYRSAIRHDFSGNARFDVPPAAAPLTLGGLFKNTSASSSLTMPDILAVGMDHIISDHITLLGEIDWTHWSRLQQLALMFTNPAQPVQSQPLVWKDGWRALVDAALAVVMLVLLVAIMVVGIQTLNLMAVRGGEQPILALDPLLHTVNFGTKGLSFQATDWWAYTLMFLAMVPSLMNLAIGGFSLLRGIPNLSSRLYAFLPQHYGVAPHDRSRIALILSLQAMAGISLAFVWQFVLLPSWIFGHVMPGLGFGVLQFAQHVERFNLPALIW